MRSKADIIEWLDQVGDVDIAIDDGGLELLAVGQDGELTGAYLEVGGVSKLEDEAKSDEIVGGCMGPRTQARKLKVGDVILLDYSFPHTPKDIRQCEIIKIRRGLTAFDVPRVIAEILVPVNKKLKGEIDWPSDELVELCESADPTTSTKESATRTT